MQRTDPQRFLDTNVLLYVISADPAEAIKRERAIAWLEGDAYWCVVNTISE